MKNILISYIILITSFSSGAQVTAADCGNAVNICQNASFSVDPNGSGSVTEFQSGTVSNPSTNPASGNSGCLLAGELNPTWMIINVAGTGTLEFSLGQDMGSGCFDWIMWPYTVNSCNQIINNQLAPVRCNWNGMCEGFTGISTPPPTGGDPSNFEPELTVTAGQQFLLCMSNYSSQTTNVPLNFFGSANVSCTAVQPVTVNNVTICPGQTATLTANSPGATTYAWSTGATTPTITVSPTTTTSYTVTVTAPAANGATGTGVATATVTVLAATNPQCGCTTTASNNGPVCVGQTFNLTTTTVTGATYAWTLNGNPVGNSQTVSSLPAAESGSYIFNVLATDVNGNTCASTTTMVVNALPNVDAGIDQAVCIGNSVTLSGSGALTYQWDNGVQNGVPFIPTSNQTYTVAGTDANNCSNTDQVDVSFLYAQIPSITPSVTIGCIPTQVVFDNNDLQAQNCIWDFGNGSIGNGCANQQAVYNQVGCYDITLTQTDGQGCDTTITFQDVICIEDVSASFYVSPGTIGPGNSNVTFYNNSVGGNTYYWDFGDGESSTDFEPVHNYGTNLQTGYTALLIATSPAGCTDSTSMSIQYEEQLIFYVPNTFTPDADEHNQLFQPIFTSGFSPNNFQMTIFNRWGELVFETFDHSKGWDGSYGENGGVVQAGVYTWIIRYKPKNNDEKLIANGLVNVLR